MGTHNGGLPFKWDLIQCHALLSLQGGNSSAICYSFPEESLPETMMGGPQKSPGDTLPWLEESASSEGSSIRKRLWVLTLTLVALLCVKPERWIEAAVVGDVLERLRMRFFTVGDCLLIIIVEERSSLL